MNRKYLVALSGAIIALASVPSTVALAASSSPTNVVVRVEGRKHTLLGPKTVQPGSGWITKGGAPTGQCPAASAQGALDAATHGKWGGKWYSSLSSYFLTSILGEKDNGPHFYWDIYVNNAVSNVGACGITLHSGDKLLFAAASSAHAYPTALRGPSTATVGATFSVVVVYFNGAGKAKPLARARVTGGGVNVVTNSHGSATIHAKHKGTLVLRTSPQGYVRAVPLTVQVLSFY
jgi:hypothetical protein